MADGQQEATPTGAVSQDPTQTGGDTGQAAPVAQPDVDKIVQARLARAKDKWSKDLQAKLDEHGTAMLTAWREERGLTDEALEKLQSTDSQAHELRLAKGELTKAMKTAEAVTAERDRYHAALKARAVDGEIMSAAAPLANNPAEIVALLRSRVVVEPEHLAPCVVDEKGDPTGQTVAELVKEYLDKNDHHMRPQGSPGAGSVVTRPGNGASASAQPDSQEARLAALKGAFS